MDDFDSFIDAIKCGSSELFEKYFKVEYLERKIGSNKWFPIHFACDKNHTEIVKMLIDQKCNIEACTQNKKRPIHFACDKGNLQIVQMLIEQKCDIEACTEFNRRPIHFACEKGNLQIVQMLIEQNCDIDAWAGEDRNCPIHFACKKGHTEIAKILIDNRCNIEAVAGTFMWRPIHFACTKGYTEIVKLLISQKCDIEAVDKWNQAPIDQAKDKGYEEIVKMLEKCDKRDKSYSNISTLDSSKRKGSIDILDSTHQLINDEQSVDCPNMPKRVCKAENDSYNPFHGKSNKNEESILKYQIIKAVNQSITGHFFYQNYSLLKDLYENVSNYQLITDYLSIIDFINKICDEFNKRYKDPIYNSFKKQSNLNEQNKLAINCVYISMNILSKFIDYNTYLFDDCTICQLFTGLDSIIYTNKYGQRLCEAILYTMCNVFKLSNAKINKEFWNINLQNYHSNGNVSEEIKLASSVILIRTEMINFQLNRKLMHKLMNIKWKSDKSYLGFYEREILDVLAIGIKIQSNYNNEFTTHEILCDLIYFGPKEHEHYETSIVDYLNSLRVLFKGDFLLILQNKLGDQNSLDDNEKKILNIMHNTFTIYGQFHASAKLAFHVGNIFHEIMDILEILKPITNKDRIASQICENILYNLCNLAKNGKLSDELLRSQILCEYYENEMSSPEIKVASAVSICLLLNKSERVRMDEIRKFLKEIQLIMNHQKSDYLGFSLDEINEAILNIRLN